MKEENGRKPYHYGNLRETLIEKGIEFINEKGEGSLSLRKIAEICGVSSAAPYTHFKNKQEFLDSMSGYIFSLLGEELEETAEKYKNDEDLLVMLGKTYVMFYYKRPQYFNFLFSRKNMEIDLSLKMKEGGINKPFNILKREIMKIVEKMEATEEEMQNEIISKWALVQGLTSVVFISDINSGKNWEERIEDIIKSSLITEYYMKRGL